ncbi:reverse transcriptase domain-containing protein [Tanacetum coccineum]|uniref:Reverse transcriptase domain-containing protein n=1 Tax=Tanacetum coccineum TaxID=301880 RepID=A0ABQ4ZJ20_9ASTR
MEFTYALRFEFTATNNEVEYEALIAGLRIAARMGVRNLEANRPLIDFTIPAVPKVTTNKRIALSKTASTSFATNQTGVGRNLEEPIHHVDGDIYWIKSRSYVDDPYIEFHKAKGTLLHERNDAPNEIPARAEIRTSKWCPLSRSFLQPWLRSSSMHSGPRSVVARALRSGYYWPTMHRDARDMIKKCNDCQVHRPIPRQPQQELTPITSPWPFHKWGIDIAGPFPVAAGGLKFLIVAIDYFTKWIEAKAVATITGNQVKRFVWDNIVCRFGLPGEIVSDNGKQFCDNPFKDWCTRLSITQRFASVKHPQTNGLVERANRSLGEGIKACKDEQKHVG